MTSTVPQQKYAPATSIHGAQFGLDSGGYANGARGFRVPGLDALKQSAQFVGQDYKLDNFIRHVDFFDDFLGRLLSTRWNANVGSDGACAAAIHAADSAGVARLTTGASATATMAANGAQLVADRNFLISNGGTVFEGRIGKISALTSQSMTFGLTDATTLAAPFTVSGTTFTATGTNAVGFVEDSGATGAAAKLNAVAVNAGGTPQTVNLGIDVSTTVFNLYRIEVDALGNANFFVNGLPVAQIALAVATTAKLAPTVGMFAKAGSASQTLDVDFVYSQNLRV